MQLLSTILDYLKPKYSMHIITNGFDEVQHRKLENSSIVDKYGFYIPNHPKLTKKELTKIVDIINSVAG